jgi:hypothetical protein
VSVVAEPLREGKYQIGGVSQLPDRYEKESIKSGASVSCRTATRRKVSNRRVKCVEVPAPRP